MKAIKSKKWYQNQIAVRKTALDNYRGYIDHPTTMDLAAKNPLVNAQREKAIAEEKVLSGELTALRREKFLYYR